MDSTSHSVEVWLQARVVAKVAEALVVPKRLAAGAYEPLRVVAKVVVADAAPCKEA
jgi:hypothetical protein